MKNHLPKCEKKIAPQDCIQGMVTKTVGHTFTVKVRTKGTGTRDCREKGTGWAVTRFERSRKYHKGS